MGYVASATTLRERIVRIEALIDQNILLIGTTMSGPAGNISMYELDDGQTRIKTNYRSSADIIKDNTALETMKQLYINQLIGRKTILRSRNTIRRGFGGYCGC